MVRRVLLLVLIVLLASSCARFRKRPPVDLDREAKALELDTAVAQAAPTRPGVVPPRMRRPERPVRLDIPERAEAPAGEEIDLPKFPKATYEPEPNVVGTVVAVVNGDIVTKEEVLSEIRPELHAVETDTSLTPVGKAAKRKQLISETVVYKVERLLALQEARRVVSEDESQMIESRVDAMMKDTIRAKGTTTRLESELAAKGKTIDAQKQTEVDNRKIRALFTREIDAHVDVTPSEMLSFYAAHATDYDEKTQVQIRQIFLAYSNYTSKQEAVAKGRDLLARIGKGEDFGGLATQYSDGPYAEKGGLWEFVTEGSGAFRPEVERVAYRLGPKAVSGPVESKIGVHIIKVEDVSPARRRPFTEVQDEIAGRLRRQKRRQLYQQFIKKLWDKSYVDVRWK